MVALAPIQIVVDDAEKLITGNGSAVIKIVAVLAQEPEVVPDKE